MTIKTIPLHCFARWPGDKDIKAYGLRRDPECQESLEADEEEAGAAFF